MTDQDLNFNIEGSNAPDVKPAKTPYALSVFKFDLNPLAICLMLRWKWITAVFFISLILFWSMGEYKTIHSNNTWTAESKIFHQSRSDRVPSFYKPVDTMTVIQFVSSQDALARVANRMRNSQYVFSRGMLDNIKVSSGKTRLNIISISASASTPETAAALANAVAEEGIAEYVRRQNSSVRIMVDERAKQRAEIEREIGVLAEEKKKFQSAGSGLAPDVELAKQRNEIASLVAKKDDISIQLQAMETRMKATKAILDKTPKSIEFEKVMDNTSSLSLEGKRSELDMLRKRYTDNNPKVKVLLEEIQNLEEKAAEDGDKTPARVIYRNNDIYVRLQENLTELGLERSAMMESLKHYNEEIKKRRQFVLSLVEEDVKYADITRKETLLKEKSKKISDSINDLEFLIGSAVPDVSLFEIAKPPSTSNVREMQFKVILLAMFGTLFFVMMLSAYFIARMKLMSSREFSLCFDMDDLGEVPNAVAYPIEIRMSCLQKVLRNVTNLSEERKILAIYNFFDEKKEFDDGMEEIRNMLALNGNNCFRLRCMPLDKKVSDTRVDENDETAKSLISVEKFADMGYFYYRNGYCMDMPELDLLKFDVKILSEHYDIISLEIDCNDSSGHLASQISTISDYAIFVASFNTTGKMVVLNNMMQIKEVSPIRIGGTLVEVKKPFLIR